MFISAESAESKKLSGAYEEGDFSNIAFISPNSVRDVQPPVKIKALSRVTEDSLRRG